jgi:pimeloyl-ACP methyl ester carboxylesterase
MRPIRWLRRGITWASLGIAGGALVVTARYLVSLPQPLESAIAGESRIDRRREGGVSYTVAGPKGADALVLLHDFYPGASTYEFRRIFPRLATDYRVYAPDWLGFGMSERPALAYTGEFYAHLLSGFLRDVVGRPAIVLAHGLAANVAVRAASDEPDLFAQLVLVAPPPLAGITGPTPTQALVRAAQRLSLGLVPYAVLATRSALRWRMRRSAAQPGEGAATDDALDHAYASAHQFGGHHALLAQLTGELDLPIQNAFSLLEPPVLVIGGERDHRHPRAHLEDLALLNPNAQLLTIAGAGDAVFADEPAAFVERVEDWLRSPRPRYVPQPPTPWRRPSEELATVVEQALESVPPDGREARQAEAASAPMPSSSQDPEEPVVMIISPADEMLDVPHSPDVDEVASPASKRGVSEQRALRGNGKAASRAESTGVRSRTSGVPRATSRTGAMATPGSVAREGRGARPRKNGGSQLPDSTPDERRHAPRKGKQAEK